MTTNYAVVTRDAITGRLVGNLVNSGSVVRDTLTGDRVGRLAPLITASQIVDALTGAHVGSMLSLYSVQRETIGGTHVGIDLLPSFIGTIREVIGRDSSYKFQVTTREVLISSPNDWTTIAWEVRPVRQEVLQKRPTMRTPPNVWSATPVPSYNEIVAQRNKRRNPISMHRLTSYNSIAAQKRGVLPPASVSSMSRVGVVREIVALSRKIPYTPKSGVFVVEHKQLVAQKRTLTAAPSVRSPISVKADTQIVLQSKRDKSRYAATLHEIVLLKRVKVFSAATEYAGLFEILAQRRLNPVWRSTTTVSTQVQLVGQRRITGKPHSDINVATYSQILAQHRVLPMWHSEIRVGAAVQILAQHRSVPRYYSDMFAQTAMQLVAQKRTLGPMPPTALYVQAYRAMVLQRRPDIVPPGRLSWWYTKTGVQIVAQSNVRPFPSGVTEVATLRVQYLLAKVYPPPGEVMGPENGVIIPNLYELALQHRDVESPHAVNASRYVRGLYEQVAIFDRFIDPSTPVSDVTANTVGQVAVVHDSYPDPHIPASDAAVFSALSPTVVGDVYPDPRVPLSDLVVSALHAPVVLGDSYPAPSSAQSDLTAFTVASPAVLGDDSFADPTVPASDATTWLVAAPVVLGDHSYPAPTDAQSTAGVLSIAEFAIVVDKTLYGIPKRTDRRRPIVSVSMW